MSVIFLIACSTDPADSAAATPEAPSAHPYTAQTPEEVDVEELTSAVLSSLERLLTIQTDPVLTAYSAALTYGTETCPSETITVKDGTTTTHWQEVCTSPQQEAIFNGPMTTWTWDEGYMASQTLPAYDDLFQLFPEMSTLRWTGAGLNGQTDITAASGVDFNCSCLALSGRAEDDSGSGFAFIALDGPSHWTGPETGGTWIQEDIQVRVSGFAGMRDAMRFIYIGGTASGLDEDYGAINFSMSLKAKGEVCEIEPLQGNSLFISIRQTESGRWTDLDLSKPMPNSCTFCTQDDVFCLDLEPMMDWEELPW